MKKPETTYAPVGSAVDRVLRSRVPEITIYFWIVKILTTGTGESMSDFLVHTLPPPVAVMIGAIAFAAAMWLQLRAGRYSAWIYWLAVSMVGVFGTMCADVLHVGFGVPYIVSTVFYAIALAVIFRVWLRSEGTLSIHSILTRRRELFYWAAVLATFALGTAAGDMTAHTLGIGFLASGIMFAVLFAIPGIAYWRFGLDPIVAFWAAYILTRPLGASFADWLGAPANRGGLGLGYGTVSLMGAALILGFVAYLARTRIDVGQATGTPSPARVPSAMASSNDLGPSASPTLSTSRSDS